MKATGVSHRNIHANTASLHDELRSTLARTQELNRRVESKHQQIRVTHWLRTLQSQPVSNATWCKNVLDYAKALLEMLYDGIFTEPFDRLPPQGPLPPLPRRKVTRGLSRQASHRSPINRSPGQTMLSQGSPAHYYGDNQQEQPQQQRSTQSKQCQTSDSDDQWEWERVWRGAFEKMRHELHEKTRQKEAMGIEMKELQALVDGLRKVIEEQERMRQDMERKHEAELQNLRALHELEVDKLKIKHRQKLQEVIAINDEKAKRRRECKIDSPFNSHSEEPYGDFLDYIDSFYTDTLHLTNRHA